MTRVDFSRLVGGSSGWRGRVGTIFNFACQLQLFLNIVFDFMTSFIKIHVEKSELHWKLNEQVNDVSHNDIPHWKSSSRKQVNVLLVTLIDYEAAYNISFF